MTKTYEISAKRIHPDGSEELLGEKTIHKPEFFDDQSEQAARNNQLLNKIRGDKA